MVELGLTDLQQSGGAMALLAPSGMTGLMLVCIYLAFAKFWKILLAQYIFQSRATFQVGKPWYLSDATFAFNAPVPPDRKCNKETGD